MTTRLVTWGQALWVATAEAPGGLKAAHADIASVMGASIGVRNTFAKLTQVGGPESLRSTDLFRAWLLLTALGETPDEWGIPDSAVPAYINIPDLTERLREARESRLSGRTKSTGWYRDAA